MASPGRLIEPVYPKPGNGRPPAGMERMLRIYFLQRQFNLSDAALEEALYDSLAMQHFVGSGSRTGARRDDDVLFPPAARSARSGHANVRGGLSPSVCSCCNGAMHPIGVDKHGPTWKWTTSRPRRGHQNELVRETRPLPSPPHDIHLIRGGFFRIPGATPA